MPMSTNNEGAVTEKEEKGPESRDGGADRRLLAIEEAVDALKAQIEALTKSREQGKEKREEVGAPPPKRRGGLSAGQAALLGALVVSLALNVALFSLWGRGGGQGRAAGDQSVRQGQQLPRLERKPGELPDGVLRVGRSDSQHGFNVTVDGIQLRRTETRVYLSAENKGSDAVEFMAGAKAILTDNLGNTYRVDPFGGEHAFWGQVPVGGVQTGWLKFPVLDPQANKLTLIIPSVFSLANPAWNVEISFDMP